MQSIEIISFFKKINRVFLDELHVHSFNVYPVSLCFHLKYTTGKQVCCISNDVNICVIVWISLPEVFQKIAKIYIE